MNKLILRLYFFLLRYALTASSWGPCRVEDQSGNQAICGGGLQERNISCLRSQGRQPVDLQKCSGLPQLPRVQRLVMIILKHGHDRNSAFDGIHLHSTICVVSTLPAMPKRKKLRKVKFTFAHYKYKSLSFSVQFD